MTQQKKEANKEKAKGSRDMGNVNGTGDNLFLQQKIKELEDKLEVINSLAIPTGKSLGSRYSPEQKASVQNGSFNGLCLGNYWEINGVKWRIVDADYWFNTGDTPCKTHHLVIMPDSILKSTKTNETNTSEGGYVGSWLRQYGMEDIKNTIYSIFGEENILNHRELLTSGVTNGYPSNGGWYDSQIEIPNEIMMYGCDIQSPAGNGTVMPYRYQISKTQFALMRKHPFFINPLRQHQWLRDVATVSAFAVVNGNGYATYHSTMNILGIRPVFGLI